MTAATDVYDLLDETWDTRDLVDLIDRLTAELPDEDDEDDEAPPEDTEEIADIRERLATAMALQAEVEPYAPDYRHGAQVIRDDHFREYAQQLAEDIGAIDSEAGWPSCHIDWDAAADSLKMDYYGFSFDGCDWWVR